MKTKEEADLYLAEYIKEQCGIIMKVREIRDFELTGEEDEHIIEQYANDYISDIQSERSEYAAKCQAQYDENFPSELDMSLNY